jgi:hypothetical protein
VTFSPAREVSFNNIEHLNMTTILDATAATRIQRDILEAYHH